MASKRITALAFLALCAAGACSNTMAPEPEPTTPPATVDRNGGPKLPDQYTIDSEEIIEPGGGNGGGALIPNPPVNVRRLGGAARHDEINPDSGESSGGNNGDRPRTAAERDRPRGRDRVNPTP